MSQESEIKLFNAITGIRTALVEDAQDRKLNTSRPRWKTWAALAAGIILVVGFGSMMFWQDLFPFGGGSGGGGGAGHPEGGSVFMSYAGPMFPLTLAEAESGISAGRHISYDFFLASEDSLLLWGAKVQDSHLLTNISGQECTVSALYPFVGSFRKLARQMPVITVNGQAVSPALHPGGYSGGFTGAYGVDDPEGSANILQLESWEEYKALLESGSYMAGALTDPPILSQEVTVYSFTDFEAPLGEFDAATQAISFTIDPEKTTILLYGFNGCEYGEEGWRRFSYFVPGGSRRESDEKYIIVIGEDIGEYALQGYKNGACEEGNELTGVSATITRSEGLLSAILGDLVDNFFSKYGDGEELAVLKEMFLGMMSGFMLEYGPLSGSVRDRYEMGMVEDIISETRNLDRIFYLEFPVTIPAGESASVTASLHKEPSYDFHCNGAENKGIHGYDLVTRLGSNLEFTVVTAAVCNTEQTVIVRQNHGFDLENGIDEVLLDPSIPHYYLEVRPADKTQ